MQNVAMKLQDLGFQFCQSSRAFSIDTASCHGDKEVNKYGMASGNVKNKYSFNKYVPDTDYVPSAVLAVGDTKL